jgi:hypothetical protein
MMVHILVAVINNGIIYHVLLLQPTILEDKIFCS